MTEFVQVCFEPVNVAFTVLLGLIGLYWMLFILGTVGLELFEFDLDLDLDTDLDVDANLSTDVDIDVDGDLDADLDSGSAWTVSMLRFINLGEVPTMIVISVLVFAMWAINLLVNYYWNEPFSTIRALALLVPGFGSAILATKVLKGSFQ